MSDDKKTLTDSDLTPIDPSMQETTSTPAPEATADQSTDQQHLQEAETFVPGSEIAMPKPEISLPTADPATQDAPTRIVSKQGDPSIFDTATVIKPSDLSISEVTRYFKELKGKSTLDQMASSSLSPFPDNPPEERRQARDRRTQPSSDYPESRRRSDRRRSSVSYENDFDGQFTKIFRKVQGIPPWMLGAGAAVAGLLALIITTWNSTPVVTEEPKKPVAQIVSEDALPVRETITQLKVEFLSDLHKNIENTKAHAPMF